MVYSVLWKGKWSVGCPLWLNIFWANFRSAIQKKTWKCFLEYWCSQNHLPFLRSHTFIRFTMECQLSDNGKFACWDPIADRAVHPPFGWWSTNEERQSVQCYHAKSTLLIPFPIAIIDENSLVHVAFLVLRICCVYITGAKATHSLHCYNSSLQNPASTGRKLGLKMRGIKRWNYHVKLLGLTNAISTSDIHFWHSPHEIPEHVSIDWIARPLRNNRLLIFEARFGFVRTHIRKGISIIHGIYMLVA